MIKAVLLGGGNVAFHLAKALLRASNVSLVQVYNRNLDAIKHLAHETQLTDNLKQLIASDIYIISVSDHAIKSVSEKLPKRDALIVHTSGGTVMSVLENHKRTGVFYPLQTFSKKRAVNFNSIPLCIESNNPDDLRLLDTLAKEISNQVYHINSIQRHQLHTAAVFVNNFVNHLYAIGDEICTLSNIDPNILQPLIQETALKVKDLKPIDAQTGPARRGDHQVIKNHLENLSDNHREIYKLLSQSIAKTYGKKL